ncbi:MAG TPA: hypothetical protein PLL10_02315 [Elusimicrobiales bacterium]|nr:hypothetical protein [Elusimicrobiales bacterium]
MNKQFYRGFLRMGILAAAAVVLYGTPSCAERIKTSSESVTGSSLGAAGDVQFSTMPLHGLIARGKASKDKNEKERIARVLMHKTPVNASEIEGLLDMVDAGPRYTISQKDDLQESAKVSLEKVNDPAQCKLFAKRIRGGNMQTRGISTALSAKLKCKEAVPDLLKTADEYKTPKQDSDDAREGYWSQQQAVYALGEIGDERAIPVLMKHLGEMDGDESNALARFGKKALPQLLEVVRGVKKGEVVDERVRAASAAINGMKDKELVPTMWQIFQNKNDKARYDVLYALLNSADKSTSPTDTEVMNSIVVEAKTNPILQSDAMEVARRKKDVAYLMNTIQDSKAPHNLKTTAIIFLGQFKAQAAVPLLEGLLKNRDKEIKATAAEALKKITGKDYPIN